MAKTVIVNPQSSDNGGNGMGFFLGIVLLIAFILMVFYFGMPYVRSLMNQNSGTQINVPDTIDVNVNQNP